jgi:hypothetical protein
MILNVPQLATLPLPLTRFCLPLCVKALLDYHGINLPIKEVAEGMNTTQSNGTYIESAAEFLASLGLRPRLSYFDPLIHSNWYRNASKKRIANHLKRRRRSRKRISYRKTVARLSEFMERGGVFEPRVMSPADLKKLIRERRPVVVGVEQIHLIPSTQRRVVGQLNHHAVIVIGYQKDRVIFLDPEAVTARPRRKSESDFLRAWYIGGGDALYV